MGNEIVRQVKNGITSKFTGAMLEWLSNTGATVVTYLTNVAKGWTMRIDVDVHPYDGITVTVAPVGRVNPEEIVKDKTFTPTTPELRTIPEGRIVECCMFVLQASKDWIDYHVAFDVFEGTLEVSYVTSNIEAAEMLKERGCLAGNMAEGIEQLVKFVKFLVLGIDEIVKNNRPPVEVAQAFYNHMVEKQKDQKPQTPKEVKVEDDTLTRSGDGTATALEDEEDDDFIGKVEDLGDVDDGDAEDPDDIDDEDEDYDSDEDDDEDLDDEDDDEDFDDEDDEEDDEEEKE